MKRKLMIVLLYSGLINASVTAQVLIKDSLNYIQSPKISANSFALNFIAMGDWGRNGEDHQKQVAVQMGKTAAEIKAQFIIATGDNFYPSGVISEQDPLWRYSFEDIYTAFSLQWDWYPVLGNHDYKSNPDAQVAYTKISRRWKMPARYYSKLIPIPGDTSSKVLILFIDTNPLIPEFYSNTEYGPNVKTQDSSKQKKWIAKELSNTDPKIKWKIVAGHHPMYSGGGRTDAYDTKAIRRSLKPIFDKYGVDVYLAGHEHSLQHLVADTKTQHFISGAASEKTAVHLTPETKMVASEYGFMIFSVTGKQLLVQTIDADGKLIYSTSIDK
ncbi:MAG: metallophosphoesterase [Chitinophagaceae bacterium]|nr:metallophosphoesterase [Chitinophagaceae bacterium]